jgi:hypothetical protein
MCAREQAQTKRWSIGAAPIGAAASDAADGGGDGGGGGGATAEEGGQPASTALTGEPGGGQPQGPGASSGSVSGSPSASGAPHADHAVAAALAARAAAAAAGDDGAGPWEVGDAPRRPSRLPFAERFAGVLGSEEVVASATARARAMIIGMPAAPPSPLTPGFGGGGVASPEAADEAAAEVEEEATIIASVADVSASPYRLNR